MINSKRFDPTRLAVIAAILVVIGDLLALIIAISSLHEKNGEEVNKENQLERRISELEEQLRILQT